MAGITEMFSTAVQKALSDLSRVQIFETTSILPDGSILELEVRGHKNGMISISDGAVVREALYNLGISNVNAKDWKRASEIAATRGLKVAHEHFTVENIRPDQAFAAALHLSDVGKMWAEGIVKKKKKVETAELVSRTADRLAFMFPNKQIDKDFECYGASNKLHKFDLAMKLDANRSAVFESVSPNSLSTTYAYLKFDDLRLGSPNWVREIVVTSLAEFEAFDLTILNRVSSHIREVEGTWDDLTALAA